MADQKQQRNRRRRRPPERSPPPATPHAAVASPNFFPLADHPASFAGAAGSIVGTRRASAGGAPLATPMTAIMSSADGVGVGVGFGGRSPVSSIADPSAASAVATSSSSSKKKKNHPAPGVPTGPVRITHAEAAAAGPDDKEAILGTISANLELLASKAEEARANGGGPPPDDLRAKIEETRTVLRTAQIDEYLAKSARQDLTQSAASSTAASASRSLSIGSEKRENGGLTPSTGHDKEVFAMAAKQAADQSDGVLRFC